MERAEVQGLVDLAIAKYHAENVTRLTRIEDRIIGIDGNGTGKIGALQRLSGQLGELSEDVKSVLAKQQREEGADALELKWSNRMKTAVVAVGSCVGGMGTVWLKHKMGW